MSYLISSIFSTRDATYDPKDGTVQLHLRGKPVQLFAPTSLKDSYSLTGSSLASPAITDHQKLKLDWVYGYRGRDARSNLYLLPTGELVYFVAAVVVLFNPDINKQRHYLGHTEEIKWYV
jgi:microtubule-associated protein-like 1/2